MAALLALATMPPPQLALCVGDGGHRQLELLSAACCPADAEHYDHAALEGLEAEGCAEDCIDTPIGSMGAAGISAPPADSHDLTAAGPIALLPAGALAPALARGVPGRDGRGDSARRASPSERSAVRRL